MLGVSASPAEEAIFLASSVDPELCLVQLQNFSALDPSFSSSASFEDKPCGIFIIKN